MFNEHLNSELQLHVDFSIFIYLNFVAIMKLKFKFSIEHVNSSATLDIASLSASFAISQWSEWRFWQLNFLRFFRFL